MASANATAEAQAAAEAALNAGLKEILDKILSPGIPGVALDGWWVGIICVLTYKYFRNFPRDRLAMKALVAWIFVLQIFSFGILISMVNYYFVTSYGQPIRMAVSIWEWSLYIGLLAIVAFSVQMFYAHRIFTLSGNGYVLGGLVVTLAFTAFGFGLASMSTIFKIRAFSGLEDHTWLVVIWLSISTACDILISTLQVFYLFRRKSRNGLARTNRMIKVLIMYILSTGLLTSVVLVVQLVTFAIMGYNYIDFFLGYQTTAIRSLCLLANLGARHTIRKMDNSNTEFRLPITETGRVITPIVFSPEKVTKTGGVVTVSVSNTNTSGTTDIELSSSSVNPSGTESSSGASRNASS
ncbi:hypothetical protein JR316_0004371 [Psilocybe cubensis]|uniref:DUF6534 domain-containing protein n=2 Tax=Psilocybe cubensis TaxID=181762 RepID=A0A8H7Y0B7_PSICU|nr:hypothetical protein JR316_0004371 [Psilocybe cubensis]KAH9482273.1 hypothetical protein JR316_0004371 [Psilocybe cubensis]